MRSAFAASLMSVVASVALATAPGLNPVAHAQTVNSGETIRTVIVEGNQRIEDRTIQSYLLVEPGDPFDPDRIDLSLKTLFATGLFADASFEKSGSDLIVRVVENPIINRVIFEGNDAIDDEKMREEIEVAPRGIFTAARVQSDVQRILELYRQSGRFAASVEPQYKPLEQNRVDLVFVINEGPVTGVRSINFIGNGAYSDGRLRSEIVTRQSRWWRFFSSNDNYDPGRLEYDRELLRQFYQNNGYYDFRVVSAVADLTPDQEDFYITYTVDEGDQYYYGDVKVETELDKLNASALRRALSIQEGNLFRGNQIENAIDTLTYAAGVAGYAFVDITPQLDPDPETNRINVTFAIDEGPRVYVERVDIVGNTATLDRVIRRELRVSEGDAFNRVLLDRSRNRVRALGYFKNVEITESPGSRPDRTVVEVSVEEQPTGELSFAAGYSSVDAFLFDVSVSQRNLRGRGQTVIARVSASQRQQYVDLRFREPRFLDRNLAAGIDIFSTRSDFSDVAFGGFETDTIGAGVNLGFPLSEHTNLGLRYRLQSDKLDLADVPIVINDADGTLAFQTVVDDNGTPDDPSDDTEVQVPVSPNADPLPDGTAVVDICDAEYINRSRGCRNERAEISSIIGYSFNWDRRNDPIEPTGGFDMSLSQDFAGVGGDVQFLRTEVSAATYKGIFKGVRASARISGGLIEPIGDDDGIRINNRFFRGGSSFRGFDVAGLGPRLIERTVDAEGNTVRVRRLNALGGKAYYQGTLEVTVPNFLPDEYGIDTALFVEAGSVGMLDDIDIDPARIISPEGSETTTVRLTKDAMGLRASAGLSVGWDSPFGPIRFDFSQILRQEEYDRTETFRFSTSTRF
ncbi:MAG: outer membrane protein assembly factor BamA [Henriciella sp.]|uniref:outer membrane protein assembly factor BamA n=1 Tax=Henriciella sp. TaxID=1968823 RepID=UPI0032EB0075